jgi:phosphate transport system substrate-binding protein
MLQTYRWKWPSITRSGRALASASALAAGVLAGGGLLGSQTAFAESVRIGGSGAALPTMRILGDAFKRTAPEFTLVMVPDLGTGGGLKALARDKIDVALSSRALTKEEEADGLISMEYGKTPFVLATSKKDAGGLTLAKIAEIYAGKTLNWPDGTPIRLVIRPVNDLDTPFLAAFSPAIKEAVALSHARPGLITSITDGSTMDDIQRLQGGLGTSALAPMLAEKRPLYALPIDGVAPTVKNLADGTYKYFKPFYVVTRGRPSAPVTRFFEFLRSAEGSQVLADSGHLVTHSKTGAIGSK